MPILDKIDDALGSRCACGCRAKLNASSQSMYFAGAECQQRWSQQNTTDPHRVLSAPDTARYPGDIGAMRWAPDMITEEMAFLRVVEPEDRRRRLAGVLYDGWSRAGGRIDASRVEFGTRPDGRVTIRIKDDYRYVDRIIYDDAEIDTSDKATAILLTLIRELHGPDFPTGPVERPFLGLSHIALWPTVDPDLVRIHLSAR